MVTYVTSRGHRHIEKQILKLQGKLDKSVGSIQQYTAYNNIQHGQSVNCNVNMWCVLKNAYSLNYVLLLSTFPQTLPNRVLWAAKSKTGTSPCSDPGSRGRTQQQKPKAKILVRLYSQIIRKSRVVSLSVSICVTAPHLQRKTISSYKM
jgi:hypothetical protein